MIRILIVDDEDVKAAYISELCQSNIPDSDILFAPRLASAMLNLNKQYDLVLCDRLLGDGFGETFVEQYHSRFPQTKIIFYSADEESCKSCAGIKCHAFESVKGEILAFANSLPVETVYIPEKIPEQKGATEMKSFLPYVGIVCTLFAVAVGYGKLSNTTDTTKQDVLMLRANVDKNNGDFSKALNDFAVATAELRTEVKNLRSTVDKLQDEIKRR